MGYIDQLSWIPIILSYIFSVVNDDPKKPKWEIKDEKFAYRIIAFNQYKECELYCYEDVTLTTTADQDLDPDWNANEDLEEDERSFDGIGSPLMEKYGYVRVMYLCLAVNVFRFLALSILDNPWMVLPLQGSCLATVWTCASSYISLVAPPHAKQHAQYALQIGYHGIGGIVGGSVISVIGTRSTFLLYAIICAVTCAGSFGLNKLFKYEGIKYGAGNFEEEDMEIMAPQGVPMARDGKITDAFNSNMVVNSKYGIGAGAR